jgi:transcriptional regulator with XRE-family HTH domain
VELNQAFGLGLKKLRKQRGLTQEDFSSVSSRTYLSSLERGLKGPTIEKLDQLAEVLNVHPTTLLMAAYVSKNGLTEADLEALAHRIITELNAVKDVYL